MLKHGLNVPTQRCLYLKTCVGRTLFAHDPISMVSCSSIITLIGSVHSTIVFH